MKAAAYHHSDPDSGSDYNTVSHEIIWHRGEKTCLRGFANSKGADQLTERTSDQRRAFVISFSESTICKLATDAISIF